MSMYICDCCHKLKDNDYDVCHETPKEIDKDSGLICDKCYYDIEELRVDLLIK